MHQVCAEMHIFQAILSFLNKFFQKTCYFAGVNRWQTCVEAHNVSRMFGWRASHHRGLAEA